MAKFFSFDWHYDIITMDWQIDNHQQIKIYRVIIAFSVFAMLALTGYHIFFGGPGIIKTWAIWVPMLFLLIQMFVFNPQFIYVAIKNETLFIRIRGILSPKKFTAIEILLTNFKGSRLKKTNSLFRGKLIIEYEQGEETQAIELSLNNFTLVKREQLVQELRALPTST